MEGERQRQRAGDADGAEARGRAEALAVGETGSSCDLPGGTELVESGVIRYDGAGGWHGAPASPYRRPGEYGTDHAGITRRLLAMPAGAGFEVRYFELDPGGRSSHERHEHAHVVVVLRGRGRVRLGVRTTDVAFGDVVHVASGDAHQFLNPFEERFGFLCIVDRERDRPVPVEE